MSRVTKDPQVRMTEIIDTAEALFNAHGYQETQISDIVKAIGVAQGTFYYYFRSKEEVVEAIIRRKMDRILSEIEAIAMMKDCDAPRKMSTVINTTINSVRSSEGLLFEYLFSEQNLHIMDKLGRQASMLFVPSLKKIIDEGIEQKRFSVAHSEETVEFLLSIIRVLLEAQYKSETSERQTWRLEIAQQLFETALGASGGCIILKR